MPLVWLSSMRTVTWSFPSPWNLGRYRATGASRSRRPASTRTMIELAVPTTLVSEAISHRVLSGSGTGESDFQVNRPYPRAMSTRSACPTTTTAAGYTPRSMPDRTMASTASNDCAPAPRPNPTAAIATTTATRGIIGPPPSGNQVSVDTATWPWPDRDERWWPCGCWDT